MELKLPFGLKDGRIVDVSQVERGLACGCICSKCNQPLIARKGDKTIHHFAHYKSAECAGATETAFHFAAKDILEKQKHIRIPAVLAKLGCGNTAAFKLYNEQTIHFDKVWLEKRMDDIIPDVIIESQGHSLIIEIAVTHPIDDIKREKIERQNISTIEIDLSKINRQLSIEDLSEIIIDGIDQKKWINNSKQKAFRNRLKKFGKEFAVVSRGYSAQIDCCPISARLWKNKPYANLIDDCWNCDYFFDSRGNEIEEYTFITCTGHAKNQINEIIDRYVLKE